MEVFFLLLSSCIPDPGGTHSLGHEDKASHQREPAEQGSPVGKGLFRVSRV